MTNATIKKAAAADDTVTIPVGMVNGIFSCIGAVVQTLGNEVDEVEEIE
jgi:hypothetical protein